MLIMFQCPACGNPIKEHARMLPARMTCPRCGATPETPSYGIGAGAVLGGFRVEKSLGRGAMGEVFLATQLSMDRHVALKILPAEITVDKDLVTRFRREIHLLARVEHPNLVTAFEAGEQEGVHFLAMSYVEGEDLDRRLAREKRLPERQALAIASKVALALAYAWDNHRILHNDVKSGNIMIDRHGDVKVMDLGLSKCVSEDSNLSMEGVAFGTPNYMSPEQARGQRDLDSRSDQFALGATLFHLVTGQLPHKGTSVVEVLTKKATEQPPFARSANPHVSPACEKLIRRMMDPDRNQRFASWQDAIAAIDSLSLPTTPTPMRVATFRPTQRIPADMEVRPRADDDRLPPEVSANAAPGRRRAAAITACAALAIVAGGGIHFWNRVHRAAPAPAPEPAADVAAAPSGQEEEKALQVYYEKFALAAPDGPALQPATDQSVNQAIEELEEANPGMMSFQVFYQIKDGFVSLDMSGNVNLVDLSPLKTIPVRELRLQNTGVKDLAPLAELPLAKLVLNQTDVADLTPLRKLPLEELSLWHCPNVSDLSPLADIPSLSRLLLPDSATGVDLLRGLPALAHIATQPDGWTQTAAEFWQRASPH